MGESDAVCPLPWNSLTHLYLSLYWIVSMLSRSFWLLPSTSIIPCDVATEKSL